ncbi:DUF6129 family protein [Shewanella dokdonensis]|uniref:DUF6129 domain-containing protein n=1 Tax=Shewanella dokdonensis TaxID=712036 RepID=A0ABX8DC75_9GAMM|nr:DUF6129 family protein [Shewanella dokdonensis]MCL1074744.1 DUF6129 family protein [Shewanella dokdonensis]QVK22276.1 hypothetical protein KHX94_12725 [Shewanella dokdonensis]
MTLEHEIETIGSRIAQESAIDEALLSRMRAAYPQWRFTLCSEDDTGEREPYLSFNGFDLHLVRLSTTGCASLTPWPEQCSGILIALHSA